MKKLSANLISLLTLLLLVNAFNGCGKKEETTGSGSTDSKKESTTSGSGSTDSKKETSTSTGGSSDIDGMINDYQKLMNDYVEIAASVKGGKMSEVTKMQELSVKMSEWAKKFAEIAPQLTDEQEERIRKISESAGGVMKK